MNARPIQAIAERSGFTTPTHFSRLFRATYGIPLAGLQKPAVHGVRESATILRGMTRPGYSPARHRGWRTTQQPPSTI
ncbi:hypothetical protein [Streptomyces sp. NPDC056647]|uniref:hypothetical protein n=1 Tax=unclassified Streptomyces TaxID=2593676 RepID=UPI00368B0132